MMLCDLLQNSLREETGGRTDADPCWISATGWLEDVSALLTAFPPGRSDASPCLTLTSANTLRFPGHRFVSMLLGRVWLSQIHAPQPALPFRNSSGINCYVSPEQISPTACPHDIQIICQNASSVQMGSHASMWQLSYEQSEVGPQRHLSPCSPAHLSFRLWISNGLEQLRSLISFGGSGHRGNDYLDSAPFRAEVRSFQRHEWKFRCPLSPKSGTMPFLPTFH